MTPKYWHSDGEVRTRKPSGQIETLPLSYARELITFYSCEAYDAKDAQDLLAAKQCATWTMELISAVADCQRWRERATRPAMTLRDAAEIVYPPQFHNVIQFPKHEGAV